MTQSGEIKEIEKLSVEVGSKAPNFALKTTNDADWKLSHQSGNVTVLLFYPQNETLVCTRQLCSVRDHWEEYLETKAVIVGVSPGKSVENHDFAKKYKLPLTLLADEDRAVTKLYLNHWFYPISFLRGVVVIDAEGIIRSKKSMLRAFRPSDSELLTEIYMARGDALVSVYKDIKKSFWTLG